MGEDLQHAVRRGERMLDVIEIDHLYRVTAQTERDPSSIENMFDDLQRGGVSYWEVAFSGKYSVQGNPGFTSFTPTTYYYPMRQVLHYVRPGAVRKAITSSDTLMRVLRRQIGANEEVTIDYGPLTQHSGTLRCRCGCESRYL